MKEDIRHHLPNGGAVLHIKDSEFDFEIIVDRSKFETLIVFLTKVSKVKFERINHN
jgi:hypothetical protein